MELLFERQVSRVGLAGLLGGDIRCSVEPRACQQCTVLHGGPDEVALPGKLCRFPLLSRCPSPPTYLGVRGGASPSKVCTKVVDIPLLRFGQPRFLFLFAVVSRDRTAFADRPRSKPPFQGRVYVGWNSRGLPSVDSSWLLFACQAVTLHSALRSEEHTS